MFPAYYIAREMYENVHLSEQRTISELNSLNVIVVFHQDRTYLEQEQYKYAGR